MNPKIAFYSDLDLTLVYSHRAMRKYHDPILESIVIDARGDEPMGYMRVETWESMRSLLKRGVEFIPTTTRTHSQYSHISIPGVKPRYAIVLSGAQVLEHGEESPEWRSCMEEEMRKLSIQPQELHHSIEKQALAIPGVNKLRCAEGKFVYAMKDEGENPELAELFNSLHRETGYLLSHQGRKSYLVPPCVDKGHAMKFLQEIIKAPHSLGAGDSVLDLSMAPVVNTFIQPSHGEAVGMHPGAIITPHRGIEAAGDIMYYLETQLARLDS